VQRRKLVRHDDRERHRRVQRHTTEARRVDGMHIAVAWMGDGAPAQRDAPHDGRQQ
jgi:hypothetical protein